MKTTATAIESKNLVLDVWGDYACFTRPELKGERVSYDVMTPSAARLILQCILWKPIIEWRIFLIEVMNPIRWFNIRRNEVSEIAHIPQIPKGDVDYSIYANECRQIRSSLILRNVRYRIHAYFDFFPDYYKNKNSGTREDYTVSPEKFEAMFRRRASLGQCHTQPYLGCREFSCHFRLVEESHVHEEQPIRKSRRLGMMLYDYDYDVTPHKPMFFKARMEQGVIRVPKWNSKEVIPIGAIR